jgi:transcriptional regulator with XRE-family HTH domain
MTFGDVIAEERKKAKLSQKELAALVKKEDGNQISPQYLNDIERSRRNAPSDFLIEQFARALKIDAARLYYWAKKIPDDVKPSAENEAKFVTAFKAFRRERKQN